jgi:hypothetical protein
MNHTTTPSVPGRLRGIAIAVLLMTGCITTLATEVALTISPRAEDQSLFKLGNLYKGRAKGGFYSPEMLRYYISGITLHLRNGSNASFPDTYILVDIRDIQRFPIGNADVSSGIDSITFHIGVDQARNHLDPTTYPDWHPLALKKPSMHWGWASGYRFVTYEGMAGTSAGTLSAAFQIHTLDNKLYTRCSIPLGGLVSPEVPLVAYYERLLNNIDVSRGLINHGSEDEAVTLMLNMGAQSSNSPVFTANLPTSVDEVETPVALHPNPTRDILVVPTGASEVQVYDAHGSRVLSSQLGTITNIVSVSSLAQGTYHVVLRYESGSTQHGSFSIVR